MFPEKRNENERSGYPTEHSFLDSLGVGPDAQADASNGCGGVIDGSGDLHIMPAGFIVRTSVRMLCLLCDAVYRHLECSIRVHKLAKHEGFLADLEKEYIFVHMDIERHLIDICAYVCTDVHTYIHTSTTCMYTNAYTYIYML